MTPRYLLVLFSTELGVGVSHLDEQKQLATSCQGQRTIEETYLNTKLLSALNNCLTLLGRNVVSNLSTVLAVVHEEKLQVCYVVHYELVEAVWKLRSVGERWLVQETPGATPLTSP